MICIKCGKEVPDNSKFCEFCGAQIDEKSVKKTKKIHNGAVQVKDNSKKPVKKKVIIIGGIAVAVAALVVVFVMLFAGRSIDKTVDKYMEAIREKDDDLLLEIMFPKDARNNGEDWYADRTIYDILKDMNEEVKDISVVNIVDADNKISDVVDDIFYEADVDIEFTELKIVNLDIQYKKGSEESQLIAYKVGNKWYILPEVFEYCIDSWQSEDVKSAEAIAISIQTALANEEVYNNFAPYYDVVIDLESDLEYLPESVQTSIMDCLVRIPEIQHTYGGAVGFSFIVNSNGGVVVYASTENNLTAWQIYPSVDNGYHDGVVQTVDEEGTEQAPINNEYSYVKLISEQSPILGYWQSDTVGLYIGYNVSGGDEGFTVYVQSQDFGFRLLHSYDGYRYSGGNGFIQFTHDTQYENNFSESDMFEYNVMTNDMLATEKYKITVVDNDTITLSTSDIKQYDETCLEPQEYTFKRAEIDKDTLAQFEGTWIDGGEIFSGFGFGTYGNVMDLEYCNECGNIHERDYKKSEGSSLHDNKYVSLYDGITLHYIFPREGLYVEGVGPVCYAGDMYTLDGNTMNYSCYIHGGGGDEVYTYLREGSDEAKMAEVLNAYQQCWDDADYEHCSLIYVNDDDIPELVCGNSSYWLSVMTYNTQTQNVVDVPGSGGIFQLDYKPRENVIFVAVGRATLDAAAYEVYKINDSADDFELVETAGYGYTDAGSYMDADSLTYTINDNEVDETAYNSFMDKYSDLVPAQFSYGSIYEAYQNLGVTE